MLYRRLPSLLPVTFFFAVSVSIASCADVISVPSLSKEEVLSLQGEQKQSGSGTGPLTFAKPYEVSIDPSTDGKWSPKTNTWKLIVQSKGAENINLGFTKFNLPDNAMLRIEEASSHKSIVTVEADSKIINNNERQYWSPILNTDRVVISVQYKDKIFRPNPPKDHIRLGFINIGFQSFHGTKNKEESKNDSCQIDVACPQSEGWEKEIQATAGISYGGSLFCTGSMINNMDEDETPYFLTASHCGINQDNAGSVVVYWNFQSSVCNGTPDGVLDQFTQGGATFLANAPSSDATLLRLNNNPDPEYDVTFAGWDNSPNAYEITPGVCIQHPNGDGKKISFEDDAMTTTYYGDSNPIATGTYVQVINWDLGTTAPYGSSGSPLFNGNKRIIGQLNGGPAACGNDRSAWFGRFSSSWIHGNFAHWLDPHDVLNGGYGGIDTYVTPTISPAPTASTAPTASAAPSVSTIPSVTPTRSSLPTTTPTACVGYTFSLVLLTDDYASETSWTLTDLEENIVILSNDGELVNNQLYEVDKCLVSERCYMFTLFDSYGDGICCSYGNGYYTVTVEGDEIASGGELYYNYEYDCEESVEFCDTFDSCDDGFVSFSLTLRTDNYPSETSWVLTNDNTNTTILSDDGNLTSNRLYNVNECLEVGPCYSFVITDSYGDGLVCSDENAYFTVDVDGQVLGSGSNFSYIETVQFCGEGPFPTSPPTVSPTSPPQPTTSPTTDPCPNAIQFSLVVKTDQWGGAETAYTLTNMDTNITVLSANCNELGSFNEIDECLDAQSCYRFEITDLNDDGICCAWGDGYFTIEVDGMLVGSGGDFGSSYNVEFCGSEEDSCSDSMISLSHDGNEYDCDFLDDHNGCASDLVKSHCPSTCGMCSAHGCDDSQALLSHDGNIFNCEQFANLSDNSISSYCNAMALKTTCRSTCGMCN